MDLVDPRARAARAAALRRAAARLAAEAADLRAEAAEVAEATGQCLAQLEGHAEDLRLALSESRDSPKDLNELNGPTWAAQTAARREALLGRIAQAQSMELGESPPTCREARRSPSPSWRDRFEAFILQQQEQADGLANEPRLAQALAAATSAIEDADCTPSMRRFLMKTLQMVKAVAVAESRRRGLLMSL
ncbi:unnamed protein product [Effrenium voratum]|nr:unnamed protein product [Effrenium voratum]